MKKPKCERGTACGYACIESKDSCQDQLSQPAQKLMGKLLSQVRGKLQDKAFTDDLIVNTGGFLASMAGKAVGGDAGALAADLGGALAVRAVLKVREAVVSGNAKAKRDEAYADASRLEQLRRTANATLSEMRSKEFLDKLADDLTGDISGWAIGNASAGALGQIDLLSRVPFKGAAVASVAVPRVVNARAQLSALLTRTGQMAPEFAENKTELTELLDKISADVLQSLQESLSGGGAPVPAKLLDFTLDGTDFAGLFADAEDKRYAFRLGEETLLYAEAP